MTEQQSFTVQLGCAGCLLYVLVLIVLAGLIVRSWGWAFG